MKIKHVVSVLICLLAGSVRGQNFRAVADDLYAVKVPVESRSISFENPTGEKGQAAQAPGVGSVPGRKGSPARDVKPGQTITLCDIKGPGVIRHIWVTTDHKSRQGLLGIVIRAYWDGQEHPSVEAPLGNFFGISHGLAVQQAYQSAAHSVNPLAGMNIWLPMPFSKQARITITNESDQDAPVFYNIDYTIGDNFPEAFGRLHVLFRRENPTTLMKDFEILPKREGMGRFIGCVLGIRPLGPYWWGEGEFKVYLDGDEEWPTIAGTGTEDYIGQSWGLQDKTYLYGGVALADHSRKLYSIYRWHIADPIYWKKDIRVTIQQIGHNNKTGFEREDDWSTTTFWYEPIPSKPLPAMPEYAARIAGYDLEPPKKADFIRQWLLLGSFPNPGGIGGAGFETDYVDETSVKPVPGQELRGRKWQPHANQNDGLVMDLLQVPIRPQTNAVAYAHTYIWSSKQQKVVLLVGSDDGCKAWLNGEEVINSGDVQRSCTPDSDSAEVELKEGVNSLLVKIAQGTGGWSFTARIKDREKAGIKYSPRHDTLQP